VAAGAEQRDEATERESQENRRPNDFRARRHPAGLLTASKHRDPDASCAARQSQPQEKLLNHINDWLGMMGGMKQIVAILMPVAIVFIALYFRHQRQVSLHETIKHLADKGMPVPKDLLDPPSPDWAGGGRPRRSPFFGAMTTLGVGVGLVILFYALGMGGLWGVGALVATIGVAQLIALAIERRSSDAKRPDRDAG
jgi:hypothetical protein